MHLPEDINDFDAGRVVALVGMPGAGKTEDLAQIVGRSGLPVFALDTVGALKKRLQGCDVWLYVPQRGFNLDEAWAWSVEKLKLSEPVVWSLENFSSEEMQDICDSLVPRWKQCENFVIAIDEIHRVAPVQGSAEYGNGSALLKDYATARRNWGVTLVWSSQRLAFVSTMIRGITDYWVVHRLFLHQDIKPIEDLLSNQPGLDAGATAARLRSLGQGDVMVMDLPFRG